MSKKKYNDYRPEIVGMEWTPGILILVASRSWGGKNQYVLGNCIVAGTKEEIPVAYFLPDGDSLRVAKALVRMQVGPQYISAGRWHRPDVPAGHGHLFRDSGESKPLCQLNRRRPVRRPLWRWPGQFRIHYLCRRPQAALPDHHHPEEPLRLQGKLPPGGPHLLRGRLLPERSKGGTCITNQIIISELSVSY